MARERMVTRTIEETVYSVMSLNVTQADVLTLTFSLTGERMDNDKALNILKKKYETETIKLVAITDVHTTEKLYGISEIEFLKIAHELDPETRKIIG